MLLVGLCAVAMTGCGASTGGRAPHHDLTLPHAACGTVSTHQLSPDTQLISASPGALGCFDAAVRNCRTGSIRVTEIGVDTGTQYVFVIQSGGRPCQVTEFSQSYSANFGGSEGPVLTASCHQAALTSGGVTLRCGGAEYVIPPTAQSTTAAS
jgi:hypothetical protein